VKKNKQKMAAAFVLLFQNERAIRRERIFRDRTQNPLCDVISPVCPETYGKQGYVSFRL
jgi:hypothetical protein